MLNKVLLLAVFSLVSSMAHADVLMDMQGAWSGSGWARETLAGPKETLRCRLNNTYDESARALTVKGRCVASGRKIALSGEMRASADSDKITGHWFNPDGLGSVRISGFQRGDVVGFTFRVKHPDTGADVAQNVEWRVGIDALRLRSTDRVRPEVMMSDISFTR